MTGFRARRRFGQNFLIDPNTIARIVDAIDPKPRDTIVEIGPGHGALTARLAESGATLHLIEIDRDLAAQLEATFSANPQVSVHAADALTIDLAGFGDAIRCVGNLPYNVSTPLLFHLDTMAGRIVDMHVMLQKEVVERMAAEPGNKTYGRLSVMLQSRWRIESLFDVPAGAFRPRPKVVSSVARLKPLDEPAAIADRQRFETIVRAAFSMRRKTLRNALSGVLDAAQIEASGVDPGARAESLSVAQFVELSRQTPYNEPRNR